MNTQISQYPMASLYVGDLHPEVSEAMLFEKFSSAAGPVLSIRVCRDIVSRKSLGYAYVNFQNPTDAERALDTMNFDEMKGRPIRIMWSQRDPSLRRSGVGNVFIKNLDKGIDQKSLYDTFAAFGNILSCKIAIDDNGQSRGYGFVHFETQEAANQAVAKVNGMLLNNKKVFVGPFVPRKDRSQNSNDQSFTNCFIKNFADELNDTSLTDLFAKHGEITSAKVMFDDNTKKCKGFGFVCFKLPEHAADAVTALHDSDYNGRKLYVARALKKHERLAFMKAKSDRLKLERINRYQQGVNLYVKNLDDSIDDEKLKAEFVKYGEITSAKVMIDSNGRSKGFGFVCFSKPEEATRAVTDMNGKLVIAKPLYVALAQRKEDRRAQLASQYAQRIQQFRLQQGNQFQQSMYGASNAGYFVPTMNQPGFFGPSAMAMARQPSPKWLPPHGGPNAAAMGMGSAQQSGNIFTRQGGQGGQMQQQQGVNMTPHGGSGGMPPGGMNRPHQMQRPITGLPGQTQRQQQMHASGGQPGYSARMPNQMHQQQILPQQHRQQQQQIQHQQQPAAPRKSLDATVQPHQPQTLHHPDEAIRIANQAPLTTSELANAGPREQKQMLGERLYPLIHSYYPAQCGKITGMLLEIDNSELLHMLESADSLKAKVEEAYQVLQAHQQVAMAKSNGSATGNVSQQLIENNVNKGGDTVVSNGDIGGN